MESTKKGTTHKFLGLFQKNEHKKHFTSAVIVAGGTGKRSGSAILKQHVVLCGKEIVARTMSAFENCPYVDEIVVVCRPGEENLYHDYKLKYGIEKMTAAVPGGETRQESALRGFEAISPESRYVAVHDAARCLITSDAIGEIISNAYKYRAAFAAKRVTDTVKIVNEEEFAVKSADRTEMLLAQTPQVFDTDLYRAAAYTARKDGFSATDDCMMAERLGFKVKACECSCFNMKITNPEDFELAQMYIEMCERKKIRD